MSTGLVEGLFYPHGQFRLRVLLAVVRRAWFVRLRSIIVTVTLAVLLIEWLFLEFRRPIAVPFCVCALAVVNVVWAFTGRRLLRGESDPDHTSPRRVWHVVMFTNAQMLVDLLVLTLILRFAGGVENPMAIFYQFHMLIAALLLRPANALLQGCWAFVLYGVLAVGECAGWIAPHYPFLDPAMEGTLHRSWMYAVASLGVLGAGIFGTLYFTLQISSRLDEQESELRLANRDLADSRESIELLQTRRSRFMQTAAHQLKGPLTGIEMLAALIRDGVVAPARCESVVNRIIARCRDALVQVSELLTLARVEEADPARHRGAGADAAAVIRKAAAGLREVAKAKGLELAVDVDGAAGVRAGVNERDLADCVTNLVDNAIKYTPSGGKVGVGAALRGGTLHISVTDTGMGIAEQNKDELFEPFRRGELALASGIAGSGLGLAIVREVVEQARGRVEVSSSPGQGSTFELMFPVLPQLEPRS